MKVITKLFLIAELLDIATTFIGIGFLGAVEANPLGLGKALALKVLVILFTILIFEKLKRVPKYYYSVPVIAGLPVVWNTFVIITKIVS